MSRTIRIKNNFRLDECNCWIPRDIPKHLDWDYIWVDGEEIGKDPNFKFLIKVADTTKEGIKSAKLQLHGDGRAYTHHGGRPADWVYRYFNRMNRHAVKDKLKKHVKLAANDDEFIEPSKKTVPYAYF